MFGHDAVDVPQAGVEGGCGSAVVCGGGAVGFPVFREECGDGCRWISIRQTNNIDMKIMITEGRLRSMIRQAVNEAIKGYIPNYEYPLFSDIEILFFKIFLISNSSLCRYSEMT